MDELKIGIIIAQIINFGILLFVFKYFLWDKIVKTIEERRNKLKEIELSENTVKNKLKRADEQWKKILDEARIKAAQIEDDSNILTAKSRNNLISSAKDEANAIINSAKREVEREKISMLNLMKDKIVSISLKINKKLFDEKKLNNDFIEKEIKNLI